MIFRAATSPEARQLITQATQEDPLYAVAQHVWEADLAKPKSCKGKANPKRLKTLVNLASELPA